MALRPLRAPVIEIAENPYGAFPGTTSLARETLPDDVAYRLARTLHGIEGELCKKLPQACETTAANRWRRRKT